MNHLTRRRFLKQVLAAGAGTAILPAAFRADEKGKSPTPPNSSLLLVSPCLVKPTTAGITINIVAGKNPLDCFILFRKTGSDSWHKTEILPVEKHTPINIPLNPLQADTFYEYQVQVRLKGSKDFTLEAESTFRTQRTDSSKFSFAMLSDSHITPNEPERIKILSDISKSILARRPDFFLMLGDNIQTFTSHGGPMTEEQYGPILYYMLRYGLVRLPESVPVFNVTGNWEGENGWHAEKYRSWARSARMAWMPGPLPDTYPEGGSEFSDYYGFTWGNTLNLVLNVTGYTTIEHTHSSGVGRGDNWTLGEKQKDWLCKQLKESTAEWKFIYIHHTVGGKAGDDINTRYGRGGGRAAKVGEQKLIHEWMKEFNVKALFYGHDHVFTDIPVDGIHYTCVGSAGAPWKFTKDETGYENYTPDSGYTWVEVYEDKVLVSFIRPDAIKPEGTILYQFKII